MISPLAWWGSKTEKLRLGTAIMQMSARTPTAAAMAALTMDHLSGGRFVLGLGVSHAPMVDGIRKQDYSKPFSKMKAYLDDMENALYFSPKVEDETVVLAALGPKML